MKVILAPTDFSNQADYALRAAAGIAEKAKALLIILHVIEEPSDISYSTNGEYIPEEYDNYLFTLQILKVRQRQLQELREQDFLKNIETRLELKIGNSFHGIASIILEQKVDLVVMGTTGHSRAGVFLGSVTNKVIRHARCPVLTLHQWPSYVDYKNIVYATSLCEDEESFSRIVRTAQHLYDGTIHLVRINTPSHFVSDHIAKSQLNAFAKHHQFKNFTVNVFSDVTEEEGIMNFAEQVNAGMIAIATHGRSGFFHLLSGSISKEVVNHSKRPVLTFLVEH